jgi:peptide/nickel transport system substrate-binding protein/oligopeptide transport system substrate-binding protein
MSRVLYIVLILATVAGLGAGCVAPAPAPATGQPAAAEAPKPAEEAKLINSVGVELPADAAPLDQQVLVQMVETEPQHLDRSAKLSASGSIYPFLISEPLVKLNEDFELVPAGAESWSVADDGVTWTFKIRPGMMWSDGQPFTARDYEYMYQRMADPKIGFDWGWFYTDIVNFSEVQKGEKPVSELGVKALDDTTLQITTVKPEPYFPQKAIMMVPAPKHIAEKDEIPGAWSVNPETAVSGGPFILTKWDKGKEMVFEANKAYTGPFKPLLEKQIYKIGSIESVMPAYESNEIDAVAYAGWAGITPADIAKAQADPEKAGLHYYTDFRTNYVALDSTKPPFDDVKVRKAFAKAIDRDALTQSAARDIGIPAYSMLMPGFHANNVEGLKPYQAYNPEEAKKLLAEAGYPDGKGFPEVTLTTYNTAPRAVLEAIAAMWKEVLGVTVNLNFVEYATYAEKRGKHELPMLFEGYQFDYTDASHLMDMWAQGVRFPWTNEEYQKLVEEANYLVGDEAKRIQLYQDAEKILVDDVGGIFIMYDKRPQFWKPYVKGKSLEPNKDGIVAFRGNKLGLTDYTVYIAKGVENFRK